MTELEKAATKALQNILGSWSWYDAFAAGAAWQKEQGCDCCAGPSTDEYGNQESEPK